MKLSQLFGQTLREAPAEAEVISHQLLIRAGYIRQLGTGIFSHLHLAHRALRKIEAIIREEIDAIGGQELMMPVVHPADLWKETGRWYQIGSEMGRFHDKNQHDMVLAMTHEEVVTDLVRQIVQSYKQLPRLIYHIQTKWRDDPRPRAGLIRVREFTMKDSYSLDADWDGLDKQYRAHYQAYFNIFNRSGLPVVAVKSDVGMMGGKLAHEFMYLTPIGEDTLIICPTCGYVANRQVAQFKKPAAGSEAVQPMEKVATPAMSTIEALANFLNVPKAKTAKAVFMMATITEGEQDVNKFVFAVVRGDMDVNETKLVNALHAKELRPATEDEIKQVGAEPGYASPVGLKDVLLVADDVLPQSPNLVAGANEHGYHLLNVNYGRDYTATILADIASAEAGAACPECGQPLTASRGIEVGNIFKLGTRYTDSLGSKFLDRDDKPKAVIMGSYGIGVDRLLACVAEQYHDERGLMLPISVAPFQVHIVTLKGGDAASAEVCAELEKAGIEVVHDDRDESPGVKFADADLMGMPIRLTVSQKSLDKGGVELKLRTSKDFSIVPMGEVLSRVRAEIGALQAEISKNVVAVAYNA